jgi:hypothetical protein
VDFHAGTELFPSGPIFHGVSGHLSASIDGQRDGIKMTNANANTNKHSTNCVAVLPFSIVCYVGRQPYDNVDYFFERFSLRLCLQPVALFQIFYCRVTERCDNASDATNIMVFSAQQIFVTKI